MKNDISTGECWHDCSLEEISIEYDCIIITIEKNNSIIKLKCYNFIGIEYLGQWDENIIKQIIISYDNEMITRAKKNIKYKDIKGGGTKEYNSEWKCLIIELIDNINIYIVCKDVTYI